PSLFAPSSLKNSACDTVCRSLARIATRPLARMTWSTHFTAPPMAKLDHLSNEELMAQLMAYCADRRRSTVGILEFLANVAARDMHLEFAASSLWDFCRRF